MSMRAVRSACLVLMIVLSSAISAQGQPPASLQARDEHVTNSASDTTPSESDTREHEQLEPSDQRSDQVPETCKGTNPPPRRN